MIAFLFHIFAQTDPDWMRQVLGPAGLLVFLLAVVVWGGKQQWWVFGWTYRDVVKERDMYREIAFKGVGAAQTSAKLAEHLVTRAQGDG